MNDFGCRLNLVKVSYHHVDKIGVFKYQFGGAAAWQLPLPAWVHPCSALHVSSCV